LSPEEWERLGFRINALREETHECREAKRILLEFHGQPREAGRIQFYDAAYIPAPGEQLYGFVSSDSAGRFLNYDSRWVFTWEERFALPHEALHEYLHRTGMKLAMSRNEQENWIASKQVYCV
jgi:hypothetical protein